MNIEDFKDYFRGLLANPSNDAIADVDFYDVAGNGRPLKDLAVHGADGVTLYLSIVRTSPPGGDKPGRQAITKSAPGVRVITSE
jgi:hypothetical protein